MPLSLRTRPLAALAAAVLLCSPAYSGEQNAYWRPTAPTPMQSPTTDTWSPGNPNGWRNVTGTATTDPMGNPIQVAPGGSIFFGAMNDSAPDKRKGVNFKLKWNTGTGLASPSSFMVVHTTPMGVFGGAATPGYVSSGSNRKSIWVGYGPPCPEWEYVEIRNTSGVTQNVSIEPTIEPKYCSEPLVSASTGFGPDDTIDLTDGVFGTPGEMASPMHITEIEIFPEFVEMDLASAAPFMADPGTGNWGIDPVFIDPEGRPRPSGGLRYSSDGAGLTEFDPFSFSFRMLGYADTLYSMYALDADSGEYHVYRVDLNRLPWGEHFDLWVPGDLLHGFGGWEGFGDDPAFDAPVSDAQSRSAPNAVDVSGAADIVRTFEGANSGKWAFSTWQYIPGDFQSGGSGQFTGTYFVLLNSYPAQPAESEKWSIQMQFDSNDGMLKVYYGDGLNTVNRPYDPDRWVKIQSVVDLDDDWTQVYYDDELVTEYEWTGGVLGGGGGGASDIAAVDLYANGSRPVYYDDFLLVPILPCSEADVTTQGAAQGFFGYGIPDGQVTAADLNFFVNAWVAGETSVADVTTQGAGEGDPGYGVPDGMVTASDLNYYVNLWILGCP